MLDQRRVATQPDENREQLFREQLFIERYESLRALALRLSNEVDAADDLVQDLFVQWVLSRTRLEEIENIDGYLRTMLRYMHFARMTRSAQHLHETALSIADYDSCHFGWTALEPPRRMQASEDLHQICIYACSRKESSKAGSVLILRFFHNYFPTEIAIVLNSSRNCVDQWQRVARREAKLFMNEPRRLRFVDSKMSSEGHQIKYLRPDGDLMLDLRQMIFNSCHGDCLSQHELEEIYSAGQTDALSTAKLAHIVSCPGCLDAVNRRLNLPLLAERYRSDIAEPKEPPSDAAGGGASGSGPGEIRKKFARRLRETHEHKPQELRIAVNGFRVSTLKISSERSELDLNLTPDEPIEFVEVSSEQGLQLLFFSVNTTRRQDEQWAWIELSEGRCLEACYQDENGPTLHLLYKDPVPAEVYVTGENSNALSSPLFAVPAVNELNEPSVGAHGAIANARSWVVRLFKTLRTTAGQGVSAEETKNRSTEETLASSLAGPTDGLPFLKLLSQAEDRARSRRRLGLLVVLVSAALIAGFLFFKANLSHTLTATSLLEQARMAERDRTADVVKHRFINLEERRSAEGAVVARHKIEIWSNHANGQNAQRLYDDSNRLVAAAWQKAGGSRTVYHHGLKPQTQPALVTPENLLLSLEDVWQLEPSPETFGKVIADTSAADVEERSTTYVLRFEKGRTIGASNLLKATLTLSKSDLHPIEQTLLVQRGNELREYRFVEASFELVSLRDVAPGVFEIEPELTGGAGELGRPGDWALRDLTASRVPPPPSTSTPPAASAELEVDVAYLLNQAKADRNEQVTLTRSAGGSLRVEGVVDTEQRKNEFLHALAPVSNNPAVKIEIRTVAEATQQPVRVGTITVEEPEQTANTVAADEDLRAYYKTHNAGGSADEAVRNYSSRIVNRSYRALFHAIELKRLVSRFANVDMRTVAPDARAKWLAMLREHANAFENDNAVLRQELQPIFFPRMASQVADDTVIQSDADLARAVEGLHKLALANNEAISSAFAISSQSSASQVKSPAFWQSILRAESLVKSITQYQAARD